MSQLVYIQYMKNNNVSTKPNSKKIIFIIFVILVGLAFAATTMYYFIKFNNQDERISGLIISLLVSSLIGPMFFLPSYLNSKEAYALKTAFVNYFMMILESVTLFLGLTLYGDTIGEYGHAYLLLIYAFFGFHIFSYPKKLSKSLIQLIVPIAYITLNIVQLNFFHDTATTNLSNFDIIYDSLFKNGYLFTWGLIIGGLLVFGKFSYMSLNQNKYKQELTGVKNIKTLYIPFILYTIFLFIPGVWYMSHGFEKFFELEGSLFFNFINIAYFLYIIYAQGQNFSNQFKKFLTDQKVT